MAEEIIWADQMGRRFVARDWPRASLAAPRGWRGAGLYLAVESAPASKPPVLRERAALKRRSAATRP